MSTLEARDRFSRDGYLAPRPLLSRREARMAASRCYHAMEVDARHPGPARSGLFAWHLRHRWAFELATDQRLLDRVEAILGRDIVLWAMACWYKEPRTGKRVPWHQDAHYWPMSPTTTVSVWIALEPTSRANGCLRILPGSHRRRWSHVELQDATSWFDQGVDRVDDHAAVDLAMAPGEAALFDEAILHGSDANLSSAPRLGVSFRYSPPHVKFDIANWSDAGRIRTFLVRGADRHQLNNAIRGEPPPRQAEARPGRMP